MNLVSLSLFPFIERPLIQAIMGMDEADFETFVSERAEQIPEFVLMALRPTGE